MKYDDKYLVMIIEEDVKLTDSIKRNLAKFDIETVAFTSVNEALGKISTISPTLIVLDYSVDDINIHDFLSIIQIDKKMSLPFIIVSEKSDELVAAEMMKIGASDVLVKDKNFIDLLLQAIKHILNDINRHFQLEKAEKELREREKMLNNVIMASHDAIIVTDELLNIKIFNPAANKLFKSDNEKLKSSNIIDFFIDTDKKSISDLIKLVLTKNDDYDKRMIETSILNNKSVSVPVEISISTILNEENQIVVLIFRDISERKLAADKLEESGKLFKTVIENIPFQITVKDVDTRRILFCNKCEIHSSYIAPDEMIGKTDDDLFSPELAILFRNSDDEAILKGGIEIPEWSYEDRNGQKRFMNSRKVVVYNKDKKPLYILSTAEDISERKKELDEQREADVWMHQKQKMEAIGTMAGGICHEINNPLTGIINYGQLIVDLSENDSHIFDFANEIIVESERIAKLIGSLQGLCKRDTGLLGPVNLIEVMTNVEQLVKTTFRHDKIKLDINIDSNIPKVYGNTEQYQHLMLNMLTNARDALNTRFSGDDPKKVIEVRSSISNENVILSVKDYGLGISDSILHKMFDPFFTTHDRTERQGLGLAVCQSIIRENGGNMYVESIMDEYSKFFILFPIETESESDNSDYSS